MKKFKKNNVFLRSVWQCLCGFWRRIVSLFIGVNEQCSHEFDYRLEFYAKIRQCKKCGKKQYWDYYYKLWRKGW